LKLTILIFQVLLSIRSETVGALGEMLGDGVTLSLHNLLDRKSQQRLGADAQPRYTLGYQLDHVWKKPKLLNLRELDTILSL